MDPLRIVAIGGGTGLSTLLHGLKAYARAPAEAEITAIVTVTDDGGSSGTSAPRIRCPAARRYP